MKTVKRILVILIAVTMIATGTSLNGFAAFSFAADEGEAAAVSQQQDAEAADDVTESAADAVSPAESAAPVESVESVESTDPMSDAAFDATMIPEQEVPAGVAGLQATFKLSDDSKWQVTALYDEKAGIPADAALQIEEIVGKDYDRYLKESVKALKWPDGVQAASAHFLNITITSKGKAVKPAAEVEFYIESKDVKKHIDTVQVVLVKDSARDQAGKADQKDRTIKAKELPCAETEDKALVFGTDEMAVFGFVAPGETAAESADSEMVKKTLKAGKVRLEGLMPEDASATAKDASETKAVKKLEKKADGTMLAAYDITIQSEGEEFQPEKDNPIKVRISNPEIRKDSQLSVWHIKDDGTKEAVKDFTVATGAVTFEADGFSVYAIVEHEGDEDVVTPRVKVHFIKPITDTQAQESMQGGVYHYTSSPYQFNNKNNEKQTTQIVQNGESLELIANPQNQAGKFFYGWYVVNLDSDDGNNITFQWTDSPKPISFETPISVSDNGDGTFTMSWTANSKSYSETVTKNSSDYSGDIYLAPVYDDYCFVNFHEIAYVVSNTSNILTRKLVILGNDGTESVTVSDVSAMATDTIRRIFRGWQYRVNNTWVSVQTVDNNGNVMQKSIDATGDVDLYPYFQEGRWLYFNTGDSGNGATYVPAQFEYAEFNDQTGAASVGGVIDSLPVTSRNGYDFGGWQVVTDNTDPNNPVLTKVTDKNGNFLPNIDISMNETYKDNDGNDQTGVAYTIKDGKLTIKYPLSSLTFYALWEEKTDAKYTVVVWKQKVTDQANIDEADKTYDYYALDSNVLPTEVSSRSGRTLEDLESDLAPYCSLTTNNSTSADFTGFKYDRKTMSDATVRGDGSTVVNIYYDRVTYNLKCVFTRRSVNTNGVESGYFYVPVLTGNFTPPTAADLQTWQAYCTQGSGMNWNDAGTAQLSDVCGYPAETIQSEIYNGYRYYFYVITANYGTDISAKWPDYGNFPVVGPNNARRTLASWWMMRGTKLYGSPGQNDTVKGIVSSMDEDILGKVNDGDGNFLIASYRTSTPNDWTYKIYFETLEGVNYPEGSVVQRPGSNNYYYLDNTFVARSSNNQLSQQSIPAYAGFEDGVRESGGTLVANFYYDRKDYTLTFDYNYPVATGMQTKFVEKTGIPYGSSLNGYDYTSPDATADAVEPTDAEIPDHYEFQGWYADASCTTPFDFDTTMPAADKIVYGKWEPVYYTISIDPAGGVINHINYSEPTDGGYDTFYLNGLTNSTNNTEAWAAARAAVGGDTSWVADLSATGSGHNTSQSTYFSAQYGTAIGNYELERNYVEYKGTADEAASAGETVYYYVNMQKNDSSGEWGLHADLRNALYLTDAQLQAYYKYCLAAKAWHDVSRPGYYDGTLPDTFEAFKEMYVKKNSTGDYVLYRQVQSGSYEFYGWYTVDSNGTLSDNPYNFTNVVEEGMTLRGVWRRVGSYYIAYDPVYVLNQGGDNEVTINGQISAWTDPANSGDEKYNDGASTTTLQQPTGILGDDGGTEDDYIFRGWRIVENTGNDSHGRPVYRALSNTYYDAAVPFTIDSNYADSNGCIHMQAVYQPVGASDRRPEVANLALNANDGYLVDGSGNRIQTDAVINDPDWKVGTIVEDAGAQELVFGNMQSNDAVHLYKYSVAEGTLDAPYNQSKRYFKHPNNYLLAGFDEGSDYTMQDSDASNDVKTGQAYIPTYAADSVISVQRTDEQKLYAVWEPMVYVTFTNRTSQAVTFNLSGTGKAMSVVNKVTGAFSREKFTETQLTLEPGESVKVVMPEGEGETFTVNGTNTSTEQLLNVTSHFNNEQTGSSTAGPHRSNDATFNLTDTLRDDETGVQVYFDGVDTVFYNTNGGTWTDSRTGNSYEEVVDDDSLIYVKEEGLPYQPVDLSDDKTAKAIKPSNPTRSGHTFIGWTTSKEAAECDPAAYTLEGTSQADKINNLAVIKNSLLWDFDTELSRGMTLYAVWGETLTVTFHLTNNHTWNETDNAYFVPGSNRTYIVTLAKGDTVEMPADPTFNGQAGYVFYQWVKGTNSFEGRTNPIGNITPVYAFDEPVVSNTDLYTSWIEASSYVVRVTKSVEDGIDGDENKEFTFTAVVNTTTYSRSGISNGSNNLSATRTNTEADPVTFRLKSGESQDFTLYYDNEASVYRPNNSTLSIFFQSITVEEASDADFTTTVLVNGAPGTTPLAGTVDSMSSRPNSITISRTGTSNNRTFTLSGTQYTNTSVTNKNTATNPNLVAFTNTRTGTDVTVTKNVTSDDYTTGDEEFTFTATYKNSSNQTVAPPEAEGYTVSGNTASLKLKDGETVTLRGVPIGGSAAVTETTEGWTAVSKNNADADQTGDAAFTLSDVPKEGGGITYTNSRETHNVTIANSVPGYGSKTKPFTYTVTLWNGDTQIAFPSSITDATFSNNRKTMTVSLKDSEQFEIEGLPGGCKLIATQTADDNYTTTVSRKDGSAAGDSSTADGLSYTIGAIDGNAEIDFVNTLKTGSCKVTKSVQLNSGETLPAGTKFTFTAKLFDSANSNTPVELSSDLIAMVNALDPDLEASVDTAHKVITFKLADNGNATLEGLPVGYFLQVAENAPGFAAYVNNVRTDATTSQIAEGENSDINFINRLANTKIQIKKMDFQDSTLLPGAVFRLNKQGGEAVYSELISNNDGLLEFNESSVTSTELTLEDGTYYLSEVSPPAGYMKLDGFVTITVNSSLDEEHRVSIVPNGNANATLAGPTEGLYTVTVDNQQYIPIPTGIVQQHMPFFCMALLVLMLLGVMVMGRRRRA